MLRETGRALSPNSQGSLPLFPACGPSTMVGGESVYFLSTSPHFKNLNRVPTFRCLFQPILVCPCLCLYASMDRGGGGGGETCFSCSVPIGPCPCLSGASCAPLQGPRLEPGVLQTARHNCWGQENCRAGSWWLLGEQRGDTSGLLAFEPGPVGKWREASNLGPGNLVPRGERWLVNTDHLERTNSLRQSGQSSARSAEGSLASLLGLPSHPLG